MYSIIPIFLPDKAGKNFWTQGGKIHSETTI